MARTGRGVKVVLVGAGGHAKAVVEALLSNGDSVVAYVDPRPCTWLSAEHFQRDDEFSDRDVAAIIGVGGVTPGQLSRRLELAEAWKRRGFSLPTVVHPSAIVSQSARIEEGAQILTGAIVQPDVSVGSVSIVNAGAILIHDSSVGAGTHVGPGAVVLGGGKVGECCMVGSGAVVLPAGSVPDRRVVAAVTRWMPKE
jgi:UDP-perosamine 4-acetyltransferase